MPYRQFFSPRSHDLYISGVPVKFVDGVALLDSEDTARIGRMRYLSPQYGVIEADAEVVDDTPWPTAAKIAQMIADPQSDIGLAIRLLFGHGVDPAQFNNRITNLEAAVAALQGP